MFPRLRLFLVAVLVFASVPPSSARTISRTLSLQSHGKTNGPLRDPTRGQRFDLPTGHRFQPTQSSPELSLPHQGARPALSQQPEISAEASEARTATALSSSERAEGSTLGTLEAAQTKREDGGTSFSQQALDRVFDQSRQSFGSVVASPERTRTLLGRVLHSRHFSQIGINRAAPETPEAAPQSTAKASTLSPAAKTLEHVSSFFGATFLGIALPLVALVPFIAVPTLLIPEFPLYFAQAFQLSTPVPGNPYGVLSANVFGVLSTLISAIPVYHGIKRIPFFKNNPSRIKTIGASLLSIPTTWLLLSLIQPLGPTPAFALFGLGAILYSFRSVRSHWGKGGKSRLFAALNLAMGALAFGFLFQNPYMIGVGLAVGYLYARSGKASMALASLLILSTILQTDLSALILSGQEIEPILEAFILQAAPLNFWIHYAALAYLPIPFLFGLLLAKFLGLPLKKFRAPWIAAAWLFPLIYFSGLSPIVMNDLTGLGILLISLMVMLSSPLVTLPIRWFVGLLRGLVSSKS